MCIRDRALTEAAAQLEDLTDLTAKQKKVVDGLLADIAAKLAEIDKQEVKAAYDAAVAAAEAALDGTDEEALKDAEAALKALPMDKLTEDQLFRVETLLAAIEAALAPDCLLYTSYPGQPDRYAGWKDRPQAQSDHRFRQICRPSGGQNAGDRCYDLVRGERPDARLGPDVYKRQAPSPPVKPPWPSIFWLRLRSRAARWRLWMLSMRWTPLMPERWV